MGRSNPTQIARDAIAAILLVGAGVLVGSGCSGNQAPGCPEGEELSQRRGQTKCRPVCKGLGDCELEEFCDDGVCLPRRTTGEQDANPADATSDADTGGSLDTAPTDIDTTDSQSSSSCPTGFEKSTYRNVRKCRRRCGGEDVKCAQGLVCKGRPGVRFCVDPATGLGDTGTDRDAGDADVAPSGLDCFSILQCRNACSSDDTECLNRMSQEGSPQGRTDFRDLARCYSSNGCGSASDSDTCLDENCRNREGDGPADRCLPRSVVGENLSCSDVILCTQNCDDDDSDCFENCLTMGSTQAETRARSYFDCIDNECPDGESSCIDEVVKQDGICNTAYTSCFECP